MSISWKLLNCLGIVVAAIEATAQIATWEETICIRPKQYTLNHKRKWKFNGFVLTSLGFGKTKSFFFHCFFSQTKSGKHKRENTTENEKQMRWGEHGIVKESVPFHRCSEKKKLTIETLICKWSVQLKTSGLAFHFKLGAK